MLFLRYLFLLFLLLLLACSFCLQSLGILRRSVAGKIVSFNHALRARNVILKMKCKAINLMDRLGSIAYECSPLAAILLLIMPMAIVNGHDPATAWLGICAAWSVCHMVLNIAKYPYKQSNGVACVNPNLESDEQKHSKGQRVLHGCVEALSINFAFTCWYWLPIIYKIVINSMAWLFTNYLAGVWGI